MAQATNSILHQATKAKKDEFYTQLSDIEKELKHYKNQFKDKIVYCNADDPYESDFFKYFASNFNALGLKKLIATSYAGSPVIGGQLSLFDIKGTKTAKKKEPIKIEINKVEDLNDDGAVNMADIEWLLKNNKNVATTLKGDGDFRSKESIKILKEADIIVTNPPFSLFREYVAQLEEYKKKFLVIGNTNAITYKEIFKLIKKDKLRTGYTNFNVGMFFTVPDYWEKFHHVDEQGNKMVRVSTSCWFTNLEVKKHKEDIILYKTYKGNEIEYPRYDNYDAIEVSKVADIPIDCKEEMGVPITFVDKYNPRQFKIIALGVGLENFTPNKEYLNPKKNMTNGKIVSGGAMNYQLALELEKKPVDRTYYTSDNSKYLIAPYARILIKNKKVTK
jgi:hypothetical protein